VSFRTQRRRRQIPTTRLSSGRLPCCWLSRSVTPALRLPPY